MLRLFKKASALTAALGLAWASTASAQALPSPAAPAKTSAQSSNRATATRSSASTSPTSTSSAQPSGGGVISADLLFNGSDPNAGQVDQTGYRRQQRKASKGSRRDGDGLFSGLMSEEPEAFDLGGLLFEEDSGWDVGGWQQFGYHDTNDGVFNTKPDDLQAQQIDVFVEKLADGSEGIGFGGRVDLLYGTDAPNTQSFGNNPGKWDFDPTDPDYWSNRNAQYGWAIPQAYGEVAMGDLSVKVGHFYTLLGYQVVPATGNFFYSIPYTFNFSEAFTHTGALATYKASEDITVYGGWTLGWDTGYDQLNQGNSFLGGTSLKLLDNMTLIYILTAGNLGWIGEGYTHSIVLDYVINDDWEYVFQSDLVDVDTPPGAVAPITGAPATRYDTIGVNQYLFYNISDKWRAGGRLEWWKADGASYNEAAIGLNWMPHPNIRVRPEIRQNWAGNSTLPIYGDETICAADVIFTF
jgi:hypothetical protein